MHALGRGAVAAALAAGLAASPAAADEIDWSRYADEDVVVVGTTDEDGSRRETKVWLVVVDGQGYIRTGNTTWGGNVLRDPDVTLQVGGEELVLTAELVEDPAVRQAVTDAFREKHGWSDRLIGIVRGSHPKIMRLHPRVGGGGDGAAAP